MRQQSATNGRKIELVKASDRIRQRFWLARDKTQKTNVRCYAELEIA